VHPSIIYAVRHGESAANRAFAAAEQAGLPVRYPGRDADVPLSELGAEQAAAIGRWWAGLPEPLRPELALCSPFRRTRQTLRLALDAAGVGVPIIVDGRLGDRRKGAFELLNPAAVAQAHPAETIRRDREGVLDYVPPDGESLWQVGDRVGELLTVLAPRLAGRRVLIVAHDAVVLMLCRVLEALEHPAMLEVNARGLVPNGSVSTWRRDIDGWVAQGYGVVPG
jgi:2,3-bisphosphoglycerate-dependent phosphoglycerate mutase